MEQYNVTGMSCAACQARVEKAVSNVPGVDSCAVSLLTNSMGVEGTADSVAIIKAVEAAGYGASLKESVADHVSQPHYDTFNSPYVCIYGTYALGLATSCLFRWQSHSHGPV